MARTSSLADRVRDPGFTPGVREVDALIDLLADEALCKPAERAIGRVGAAALPALSARLEGARPPLRGRIVRAVGRMPDDERAVAVLLAALEDADDKTRRNAAIALGHAKRDGVEDALLRAWERDPRPEMRRTLAASLGKVGTARALPLLRGVPASGDTELARIAGRATTMIERTTSRPQRGAIDAAGTADRPLEVVVLARRGVEGLLADELSGIVAVEDVRVTGRGQVRARLVGPLHALFAARTMLSLRFPVPTEWVADGGQVHDAIARALASETARAVFGAWTAGPVRYRIAWEGGGHRRAATWDAVHAVARLAPALVNDPTESTWEVVVSINGRFVDVAIAPRALHDPRFDWRRGDVPAASHPTIASALARVAGVREDDVVWDPFVGSGSELVERARLGPFRELVGTDLDPRALVVARANLDAAGMRATLEEADALAYAPPGVTLVVTNPPMGLRASRTAGLADMLDRFVAHAASLLAPGGRLVWVAPHPQRARTAAARAGLSLEWSSPVDMGGFDAEMQRWVKT